MFKGYLEFGGELANIERTEAYLANLAPSLPFIPQGNMGTLHIAAGDVEYRSPILDGAPWANPNDPVTDAFYGMYPLDVSGIGSSTYAAQTTESVADGGSTQQGRNATRDVKVSGLLIGATELAAEAGLTWLRNALQGVECQDQCGGGSLRYFLAEPPICAQAWGPEDGTFKTASFGSVTGPSPQYAVRWTKSQVEPSMPSRSVWSGVAQEGTEIIFGARTTDGTILASEDVYPLRWNYALNPTFFRDTSSWTVVNGTWQYSGGADGGGCVQLTATAGVPALVGTAQVGSAQVTSATSVPYGSGPYGTGPFGGTTRGLLTSAPWATPAGLVDVSVALKGDGSPVRISLIDAASGHIVTGQTVYPTGSWQRYTVTGTTSGTQLQISPSGLVSVDQAMAESAGNGSDYFDGTLSLDGYDTGWLDTPNHSPSVRRYAGPWETVWNDSDYEPFLQVVRGSVANLRLTWYYRESIDVETQLLPYDRSLHDVAVTQGPQVIQRVDNTDSTGGYFIQVEILLTAGNPFSYSPAQLVAAQPAMTAAYTDPLAPSPLRDDWLFDPAGVVPSSPPGPPGIVADAIDASITSWQRYYFPIPADKVADWASSVPILQVDSLDIPVRQIRVRFHPNPFNYSPEKVDPTSYCADFLVSYLPERTSLLMNGMVQSASASKAGVANVPAESILYGSDGGPMTWPHLSCGIPYVMTVDVPSPADYDTFDLTLQLAREE